MFTLATFLVQTGYLAENKVLPKKESRTVRLRFVQVKVACCNFAYTHVNVCIEKIIKILHPLRTASDKNTHTGDNSYDYDTKTVQYHTM